MNKTTRISLCTAMAITAVGCASSQTKDASIGPDAAPDRVVVESEVLDGDQRKTVVTQVISNVWIHDSVAVACGLKDSDLGFEFDSAKLDGDANLKLGNISQCLTEGKLKDADINIVGYADARGTEDENEQTAKDRAQNVADFLMNSGVKSDRLEVSWKGEDEATMPNTASDEVRAVDRRVEISVDG